MRLPKSKAEILEEEVAFLRAQVAQLQSYILMHAPGTFAGEAPRMSDNIVEPETDELEAQYRLHTTEEEEDIFFRREEGLIGEEEAKRLLEAIDADSTDVRIE